MEFFKEKRKIRKKEKEKRKNGIGGTARDRKERKKEREAANRRRRSWSLKTKGFARLQYREKYLEKRLGCTTRVTRRKRAVRWS
jgi:hypothetical protein